MINSPREGGGFGAGQDLDHSGVRATWPTFSVCMLRYAIRICQTGGVGETLSSGCQQVASLLRADLGVGGSAFAWN
jgi:hypothetical protein